MANNYFDKLNNLYTDIYSCHICPKMYNEKADHYINWGRPDWSYEDYKLLYNEKSK